MSLVIFVVLFFIWIFFHTILIPFYSFQQKVVNFQNWVIKNLLCYLYQCWNKFFYMIWNNANIVWLKLFPLVVCISELALFDFTNIFKIHLFRFASFNHHKSLSIWVSPSGLDRIIRREPGTDLPNGMKIHPF